MRVLDLFSGIGGFSLGLERAGMTTAAFVEIDPFCRRVLAQHWPSVPIYEDVRKVGKIENIDLICGGFPCQPHSLAGERKGAEDDRDLWPEFARLIGEIRPRWVVAENVRGLLSSGGGAFFGSILRDLAGLGYDAQWDCVSAGALGAPHRRERVWIVAYPQGGDEWVRDAGEGQRSEPKPGKRACPALLSADTEGLGRGAGRTRRPFDGFAWVRNAARWHAANTDRAGLALDEGQSGDTRQEREAAFRDTGPTGWECGWPSEPAVLGVDDGLPDRVDRTKALGNSLAPTIPELIGRAIIEYENN